MFFFTDIIIFLKSTIFIDCKTITAALLMFIDCDGSEEKRIVYVKNIRAVADRGYDIGHGSLVFYKRLSERLI